MNEKHHKEYLKRLGEIEKSFPKLDQDKLMDVIGDIKKELEVVYQEKFEILVNAFKEELEGEKKELSHQREKSVNVLEVNMLVDMERLIKEDHEFALIDLSVRHQDQMNKIAEYVCELEQGHKTQKLLDEVVGELRGEYSKKEENLNKEWREHLESYKVEIHESLQQRTDRMNCELDDLVRTKLELGLRSFLEMLIEF